MRVRIVVPIVLGSLLDGLLVVGDAVKVEHGLLSRVLLVRCESLLGGGPLVMEHI